MGSGHVSHRRTSSFNNHFDHGFVIFKDVQLRFVVRRMCVGGHVIHLTQLITLLFSFDMLGLDFWNLELLQFPGGLYVRVGHCRWLNVVLQSLCPKDQGQVTHPYAIQHPEK